MTLSVSVPSAADSLASESVQRVSAALAALGHPHRPVVLGAGRTAQQAADSLGVQLGQIAKSIIFFHVQSGRAVLVVCAGDRRVDEAAVAAQVGALAKADADFVRAATGFAIGGVSPVGHTQPPIACIDDSLWRFDRIWAAAGHPNAVFELQPDDLPRWLGAQPSAVTVIPTR